MGYCAGMNFVCILLVANLSACATAPPELKAERSWAGKYIREDGQYELNLKFYPAEGGGKEQIDVDIIPFGKEYLFENIISGFSGTVKDNKAKESQVCHHGTCVKDCLGELTRFSGGVKFTACPEHSSVSWDNRTSGIYWSAK